MAGIHFLRHFQLVTCVATHTSVCLSVLNFFFPCHTSAGIMAENITSLPDLLFEAIECNRLTKNKKAETRYVRSQVLMAANMKITAFWDIVPV